MPLVGKFCVVTVIIPDVAAVEIEATYLLEAEADSPQPQVSAVAGTVAAVWKVSVIVVRHALIARIASETFARTV